MKASPFRGCENGRVLDDANVMSFMSETLSEVVASGCGCTYPPAQFVNATLHCTSVNSSSLVYRAYVVPYGGLDYQGIVSHIRRWVETGPSVLFGVTTIMFDDTCDPTAADVCVDDLIPVGSIASDTDTIILLAVLVVPGVVIIFVVLLIILSRIRLLEGPPEIHPSYCMLTCMMFFLCMCKNFVI